MLLQPIAKNTKIHVTAGEAEQLRDLLLGNHIPATIDHDAALNSWLLRFPMSDFDRVHNMVSKARHETAVFDNTAIMNWLNSKD